MIIENKNENLLESKLGNKNFTYHYYNFLVRSHLLGNSHVLSDYIKLYCQGTT